MKESDKKEYIERLEILIKEGESLQKQASPTKKDPSLETIQNQQSLQKWLSDATNFVKIIAKETHYDSKLEALLAKRTYYPSTVREITGLLESLCEALKVNFLEGLETLMTRELSSDLLIDAEELLKHGYNTAAAVLVRVALEKMLNALVAEHGVKPKSKTANECRIALETAKLVTPQASIEIRKHIQTGNKAAHGDDGEFGKEDVQKAIDFSKKWINDTK